MMETITLSQIFLVCCYCLDLFDRSWILESNLCHDNYFMDFDYLLNSCTNHDREFRALPSRTLGTSTFKIDSNIMPFSGMLS